MTPRRLLLVALGGTIGTAARLAVSLVIADAGGFPISTLTVNVLGALLIGILAARSIDRVAAVGVRGVSEDMRVFVGTGVLGGFTTYSAFATGTIALWADAPLLAAAYAAISLVLGITAAALGLRLGRPPAAGGER